jgi:hypothetical protein
MPAKADIHFFLLDWIPTCERKTLEDISQKFILAKVLMREVVFIKFDYTCRFVVTPISLAQLWA